MDEEKFNRLLDEHQATSCGSHRTSSKAREISGNYSDRWQVKW